MRYHEVSHISVIGPIWWPSGAVCALDINLSEYDIDNMRNEEGTITREDVEDWLGCHSGDFQSVQDFSAIIGYNGTTYEFGWESDESEMTYVDAMYGEEE